MEHKNAQIDFKGLILNYFKFQAIRVYMTLVFIDLL